MNSATAIVIVAAGEGSRLGYGMPKAYVPLAGVPLFLRAFDSVAAASTELSVVVVAPADLVGRTRAMIDRSGRGSAVVVAGGESRHASVRLGLDAIPSSADVVLVHDAARALTPGSLMDRVVDAVRASGNGVVPGLPIADTIKRTADRVVIETVDRSLLTAVQTPQGFPRDALISAYESVTDEHTDDTAVFAAAGGTVEVVAGEPLAFKVTTADDLARAESLLAGDAEQRVGTGIDAHAFGDGPLRLAGLDWPGERGLSGHSDGDAVAHAICDALLSAAGLGDIGARFGTADPRYAGASGEVFVTATIGLLAEAGFVPVNVSVQIVGNSPRFSPRRAEAQAVLSAWVGAPVTVSATTTDGLGFTGRGEGIAAVATALIRSGSPRNSRDHTP
ncbi:bifunctional 2-C-methyl-D-erythritol 4-phosphate cytidylyltransferase/2-C-methyl-D-erythritol 2,4-cyclodiphosphate synthase [Amnibacterium flavum]|uniref:Bifunctional enzyme IspD/IspF n=2 Tax=Amnibacterium flavum TaxID=2173173 RepID=A0A2V1HXD4_9MICO|nr:2-C-methyl-D-erythritol 4-phosphate cytidylyltransferase [Amnibacterium flavum]PVZ94964.1 bifunctional 2-C-methyl-D-erythritol 4-phosphate cytidylyltransferase/2-C-methyl-D-erythritol 2,4-cyclodiphosphate synthase [Amnibacterium flavum]